MHFLPFIIRFTEALEGEQEYVAVFALKVCNPAEFDLGRLRCEDSNG